VDSWYRYYAGYSASFVEHALEESAPKARLVLDPWNGTGTTTVVAASKNIPAIGFDVNPALVVVSRARLLGAGVWASIDPLGHDVIAHATPVEQADDPLRFWFTARAAGSIRGLQQSVHRLLVDSGTASQPAYETASGMSTLAGFFYTVLFRTVRVLIAPRAGTNPTWWKRVEEPDRLDPSHEDIAAQFQASATELAAGLHRDNYDGGVDVRVGLADSRSLPLEEDTIDAVVGSPPYCTRIDYGVATRPELAVLGAGEQDIKLLRSQMVGTPTMTGDHGIPGQWGPTATAFLAGVAGHASKASGGYYTSYFRQYYAGMWCSLGELRRVMRDGAPAVLVVQDNHYKDLHNNTAKILGEMATALGFESAERHDFPVVRNRASMNPRTRQYRTKASAVESILVLRLATTAVLRGKHGKHGNVGFMERAQELIDVVAALRDANDALVDATNSGDVAEATRLLGDIAVLERRRNRLVHKSNPDVSAASTSYESSVPLRDQVIRALRLTGRPSSAPLVSDVTKSRWAERVDTGKLSYLRRDESRSWQKSQQLPGRQTRDVYVVPALTYDRFTPVRGTIALSTWPTSLRLIAPLSPRVDMLRSTIALAEEASAVAGTPYEAPMMRLVSRLGATIPGVKPFAAEPLAVISAAKAELQEIEETDELERSEGAERAHAQLDTEALLFGAQIRSVASPAVRGPR
jgi:hypothetical protein